MTAPWGTCNLCGWPIARIGPPPFGTRCVRCLSTQIHRALGSVVSGLALDASAEVYELSSRGAIVRFLGRRFQKLYVSEYFDDVPPGGEKRGVPCQDVQALHLQGDRFDLVTSTEVFEHVPDDIRAFREVFRVLRPRGVFAFTVPMTAHQATVERAVLLPSGQVRHLLEAEYHSDRFRGKGKVLAYRTYGRDLVQRLASVGFEAETVTISSVEHRIGDVPVNVARKP